MKRDRRGFRPYGYGVCLLLICLSIGNLVNLWAQTRHPARGSELLQRAPSRFAAAPARATAPSAALPGIVLKQNLLSVDVRDQDLRTVLESIAAQGDIDLRHADELPEKRVSIRFVDLPLVDGLKRLFRATEVAGYALVTNVQDGQARVQRILFLATEQKTSGARTASLPSSSTSASRRLRPRSAPPRARPVAPAAEEDTATPAAEESAAEDRSVFEDIKSNTTARRLLSQLVHPNDQVRERAMERLIQLVDDDQKQAELLEFLEPLMEDMASEDSADREAARAEIRKLLRR
jgi:type II secretory pathway component GspD/PulD (secretin)